MPIAPAIPVGGLAGLRLLDRTHDRQFAVFNRSPDIEREIAYFLDKGAEVTSVDALMADRRLLSVVLGAFGLDEDIEKRAFIRKVIEDGTSDPKAFAKRLVEPAYAEMSAALGFGDLGGLLVFEGVRKSLVGRYRERQFERALGEQDVDLRLALNFRREAARIAATAGSDDTAWLKLLGSQPLRRVVESALNLPDGFARIGLDQQLAEVRDRAAAFLGSATRETLASRANIERLVERFLLRAEIEGGSVAATTPGTTALSLLQSVGIGQGARQNLFSSNLS